MTHDRLTKSERALLNEVFDSALEYAMDVCPDEARVKRLNRLASKLTKLTTTQERRHP